MSENNKRDQVTNCTRLFLSCTVVDNVLSDKEAHYINDFTVSLSVITRLSPARWGIE